MTLIWWKINGFIDASTAGGDEDGDTKNFDQNLYQNLTNFDIVKWCQR